MKNDQLSLEEVFNCVENIMNIMFNSSALYEKKNK